MKTIAILIMALCFALPSLAGVRRPAVKKQPPRILFIGNSFTYFHDLYKQAAEITGGYTVQSVVGGASLSDHLDPAKNAGKSTLALLMEPWDYVVIQEQSSKPMREPEAFLADAAALCAMAREAGAKPVMYATWPYRKDSDKLKETGRTYGEMFIALTEAYHRAARDNGALIADVGTAFYNSGEDLLEADSFHPNSKGTALAADIICRVIMNDYD